MKKTILLICILLGLAHGDIFSQDEAIKDNGAMNIVSIGIDKADFQYERVFNSRFSGGLQTKRWALAPSLGHIAPFVRYYFKSDAPSGLYLEGTAGIKARTPFDFATENNGEVVREILRETKVGIGRQFLLLESKRLVLNIYAKTSLVTAGDYLDIGGRVGFLF